MPLDTNASIEATVTSIGAIQGEGHRAALEGQAVTARGIVTALESNGFFLQDAGDGNDATSDAIFVFTGSGNVTVAVGDAVSVSGTVTEFVPGGAETGNLSTTQISSVTDVTVESSGNALPEAVVIGAGGRVPPTEVVEDDDFTSFDPATDGIDFYEALEAMRVTVQDAVAVSPTNRFGEIFVLADNGAGATGRNDRGGIDLAADDQNPERVQIQFDNNVLPGFEVEVNVGDRLGDVTGVLDYNFGNFEVKVTEPFTPGETGGLEPETTALVGSADRLTVATYNVLNLDPGDTDQLAALAAQIVSNLGAPDVLALQEIQDGSGEVDDGTVSGEATLQALVDAIAAAGGPVYAFAEVAPADGTSGGAPGANIRPAFLYDTSRVELVEGSVRALQDEAFTDSRAPLEAQFQFNGQTVTLINNHLASKSGSTPIFGVEQPLVDVGAEQRLAQAQFLNEHVRGLEAADPGAKVVVLGDFNDFGFSPAIEALTGGSGTDQLLFQRLDTLEGNATYSYIFDGNSQQLDHIFVNGNLQERTTLDIVHVNTDFAQQVSDHDPIVAEIDLSEEPSEGNFVLQILHASDLEAGLDAIGRAANFAAIVDKLEDSYENSITLSGGDNYIPGAFFSAGGDPSLNAILNDVYNDLYDTDIFTGLTAAPGRVDMSIMNVIGFDASALGNHEFDLGTSPISDMIRGSASGGNVSWIGAQFPYLSANLDFSRDGLNSVYTDQILPNTAFQVDPADIPGTVARPKIAPATILEEGGELIGVVGATTPMLESLSSPGAVDVKNPGAGTNDMAALAQILQPTIDALLAQGIDKIIVASHLQEIGLEKELAGLLKGVDVIIAAGSHTLQADDDDALHPGDVAAEGYPFQTVNADGDPTLIVSTSGEYSYVGRLVVEFDSEGRIVLDSLNPEVNGAYASTDEVVQELWGNEDPFAEGTKGELVDRLIDGVAAVINEKDGNIFGSTEVFLEGRRTFVRSEETNFGNLTADANLATARQVDPEVMVSIKNGGGIRAQIGEIEPATGNLLPTGANPAAGKEAGEVSQLDIENALRFNNALSIVTITAEGLLALMEHGFSGVGPGATPGAFPQIGGMEVSYDPSLPAGSRVQSLAVVDGDGNPLDIIARNGEIVGDAGRAIKVVTLTFLADGGDGYPFGEYILDRIDLGADNLEAGRATFAAPGTEQDALAEYLAENYADRPYDMADTPQSLDERIQNLAEREDTVLDVEGQDLVGTDGDDVLTGGLGNDTIDGGYGDDVLAGGGGDDTIRGGYGADEIDGGAGIDTIDGGYGNDVLFGGEGDDVLLGGYGADEIDGGAGHDRIEGGNGADVLLGGEGDDWIHTGYGDDQADGGAGDDWLGGGYGKDTMNGGDGDDILIGGAQDDVLSGGAGDDRLGGNAGADVLEGGEGADRFMFSWVSESQAGGGIDRILDFNQAEGDLIHLGGIDANAMLAGNQAFTFIGMAAFAQAGDLRYVQADGDTRILGDVDGDGAADLEIVLTGTIDLRAADFIL